jgi:hypothetical protein
MAYESEAPQIGGDPNDAPEKANLVNVNDWVHGNLSSVEDDDYFKFSLDSPGLLTFEFNGGDVKRVTSTWRIDLLDANLDYLKTLGANLETDIEATLNTEDTTEKTINVTGVSSAISAGDFFTNVTSGSDTTVYKVISATSLQSGSQTLTLDKAWVSATETCFIALDPARVLANGASSALQVNVPAAGTFYVKVSDLAFSDAEYSFRVGFLSSQESDLNGTPTQAINTNNRIIKDVSNKGTISQTDDVDVWLISTASGGAFTLTFDSGDNDSASEFNVDIRAYTLVDGKEALPPVTSSGQVLGGTVVGSKTYQFDGSSANGRASVFVVTVTSNSIEAGGTGSYSLLAQGSQLNINDSPLIHIGDIDTVLPNEIYDLTDDVRSAVPALGNIALNQLFTATDADASQTLSYQFSLVPADGSDVVAVIEYLDDGSYVTYDPTKWMTAAQLETARISAGDSLGELQLQIQARDSSGLAANSDYSSIVRMTVNVVSADTGVSIIPNRDLVLTEGAVASDANYDVSLSIELNVAPAAGENVTVLLSDPDNEFLLSKTRLVFTSQDFDEAQTVRVRARADDQVEEVQGAALPQAELRFAVDSDLDGSAYSGLALTPLTFEIGDPTPSSGYDINATVRYWNKPASQSEYAKLAGVRLALGSESDTSTTSGVMALSGVEDTYGADDGVMTLVPTLTKATSKDAASISLSDVIASLKLFLGLDLPQAYRSPYNYVAADLDANGKVELGDVISLLKVFLGLQVQDTKAMEWVFVDAADGAIINLSKNNASAPPIEHDFAADANVDLVGIIRGDVDGSWGTSV